MIMLNPFRIFAFIIIFSFDKRILFEKADYYDNLNKSERTSYIEECFLENMKQALNQKPIIIY